MTQRLTTDILLEVFAFNTGIKPPVLSNYFFDMTDTLDLIEQSERATPLTTTRLSSQVCTSWRDIIINTPTIWGRSMDLDELQRARSPLWATEVYRRAGQSMMSVKALFWGHYSNEVRILLLMILNQDWERVYSLELGTLEEFDTDFMSQIWKVLGAPALQLVSFKLLRRGGSLVDLPPNFELFANKAPSLQLLYAPEIPFSLQSSLLSNLTHFGTSKSFEVREIINALSNMPCLKSLILHKFFQQASKHGLSSYPTAVLPHLYFFDVGASLEACLSLLGQIRFPTGCLLNFRCDNRDVECLPAHRDGLRRFYKDYLDGYLHANHAKSLSINIRTHKATIRLQMNVPRYGHTPGPQLSFVSTVDNIMCDLETILFTYLSTLSERNSSAVGVTSLLLHWNLKSINAFSSFSSTFAYFPSAFTSLYRLTIDPSSLDLLLAISKEYAELFPSLYVLEIIGIGTIEPLYHFLNWRVECGRPIQTLDMTKCFSWIFKNDDTTYWDSLPGMKLVYREHTPRRESTLKEYACGNRMIAL